MGEDARVAAKRKAEQEPEEGRLALCDQQARTAQLLQMEDERSWQELGRLARKRFHAGPIAAVEERYGFTPDGRLVRAWWWLLTCKKFEEEVAKLPCPLDDERQFRGLWEGWELCVRALLECDPGGDVVTDSSTTWVNTTLELEIGRVLHWRLAMMAGIGKRGWDGWYRAALDSALQAAYQDFMMMVIAVHCNFRRSGSDLFGPGHGDDPVTGKGRAPNMPPKGPEAAGEWVWSFFARPSVVPTAVLQECHARLFSGWTTSISFRSTDTILELKGRIAARTNVPIETMALLFGGNELPNDHEARRYLSKESSVYVRDRAQVEAGQAAAAANEAAAAAEESD